MEKAIVSGIQQIGIGVADVAIAWKWYKEFFGTDVIVFDEQAPAEYMLPYTGGEPRARHAILALNLQGGGGFEIWQHKSITPRLAEFDILPGDYGIYACKIKCKNVLKTHKLYIDKHAEVTEIFQDSLGRDYFYVRDPFKNLFQVLEVKSATSWFREENKPTGGVYGAIVGTHDMTAAIRFYSQMLGYDKIYSDKEDVFEDFSKQGTPACRFRRVLLGHEKPRMGAFSRLLGPSEIELVQALDRPTSVHRIFENRMWGELGFIQICYDIRYMESLREMGSKLNYPFTVYSLTINSDFDMGDAAGHFAYNEDPSGTLIEYVETWKIPVLKKFGVYLNLKLFNTKKPLPDWLIACLRFVKK
ncbi:MAG: VOC family protein [Bacteroidales bacterium]